MTNFYSRKLMNLNKNILLTIFFIIFFTGQALGSNEVRTKPVDFAFEPILSSEWICYIQDNDLYIRNLQSDPYKIRSGKDAGGVILNPALLVEGDSIFVAWVEQAGHNYRIRFTKIKYDGRDFFRKNIVLKDNTKATHAKLFTDEKDTLFLIETASGKTPELAINLSLDRGEHFKRTTVKLDDLEALYNPTPLPVNDTLYLFFAGIKENAMHIGMKSFEIPSMNLREDRVLKKTRGISFIESLKIGGSPLVIYKTMHGNIFYFEGFVKENETWKPFEIKGVRGLDVARIDYHVWESDSVKGRILIVFSGEERGKFKQRIYTAVSEDGGKNWDVQRIDSKEFDNTKSWLPRMAVDGDKVVVVWEDSRNIRSGIWAKISTDRGKSWFKKDILISDCKLYAFRPRISFTKGTFYITWHQFKDDEKKIAYLVLVRKGWNELVETATKKEEGLSLDEKKSLLKKRVEAYWEGMTKKDMKTTYEIHDPFYRARIPYEYYVSHRGPMVYLAYSIEDMKIQGNIATVKIKVKYEVPKITILGKDTYMPPKEITAEDTYLFLDSTWYRKYVDALSGGSAIDY